ncbi:MAG: hypothetical protein ACE5SV_08770 [Candidatus Nitrosomaritimum aestuariumsis]
MNLSKETVDILKNYSTINNGLWFSKDSNIIKTMSPQKTIVASAKIDESFDKEFGIYDLPQFLSSLSLFDNPEIELENNHLKIFNGKTAINYYYAERRLIIEAPEKDINFPEDAVDIEFDLSNKAFSDIIKAAAVLQVNHLKVEADGKEIALIALDPKNPTSNNFRSVLGETKSVASALFKIENLKFVKADYHVRISSKGISHFSTDGGLQYWVPLETK